MNKFVICYAGVDLLLQYPMPYGKLALTKATCSNSCEGCDETLAYSVTSPFNPVAMLSIEQSAERLD